MSSGCGDVLSLEDLKIAKLHQLFEAEVITGKSGGTSAGADIDYAVNQVTGQTQKTLPAVLRDAGFYPASFDFTSGGTLNANERNKVVYDQVSKAWYSWSGSLPKVVPAGTNPILDSNWKPQTDPDLRTDLISGGLLDNAYSRVFPTVAAMVGYTKHVAGNVVRTAGYYSSGDGGGSQYLIKSGSPAQDESDAGSVVITPTLYAMLFLKNSYDFKEFGVVSNDQASASLNDAFIALAVKRASLGKCRLIVSDTIYFKKPIVLQRYIHIEGQIPAGEIFSSPQLIKIDNTKSGLPAAIYPGTSDLVPMDVDAAFIFQRNSDTQTFSRSIILKNFSLRALSSSSFAVYMPHAVDFDLDFDSRGFNCAFRFFVAYLGRLGGRHLGLGVDSTDISIGVWATHFSTALDCGNSVTFRLSLNNYARMMQLEYFGNAVLDRCTFEKNQIVAAGGLAPYGLFVTDCSVTGVLSCETVASCIVRVGNNSNVDLKLAATFHVDQNDTTEGLIHVLSGGRLNLNSSTITANTANTLLINENGGYFDISSNTRLVNTKITSLDNYRMKNRTIGFSQTTTTTATSFSSGQEVTFSGINGIFNGALSGGTIQFNNFCLLKITIQARAVASGSLTFGINGASSENVSAGQQVSMVVPVVSGDILNIKAVGALSLSSSGGVRVLVEPVL